MRSTDSGVDPSRAPLARHADSADSNAEEGAGAEEPPPPLLLREEEPPLEEDPPPVSYTHLTLPTICSV